MKYAVLYECMHWGQYILKGRFLVLACFLAAMVFQSPRAEGEEDLPFAKYDFEGPQGSEDASGNGYDATLMKEAAVVEEAERGKVLYLDGVDDEFRIGDPFSKPDERFFPAETISLSLWVKLEEEVAAAADLFQYVGAKGSKFFVRVNPGNNLLYYVSGADGPRYIRGNRPLETGKWHHLTATYKGDEGAKLYLDGEEIANGPALGDLAWGGGNSLRIGGFTGGAKAWLKGWVDEVQIFAKNLSVEEIAAIMTPPEAEEEEAAEPALTPFARYNFESEAGNEDASGNAYDGTLMKEAAVVEEAERGRVLYLDGVDDEFRIGDPFSKPDERFFPAETISLSLWVKLEEEVATAADLFQYVGAKGSKFFVRVNLGNNLLYYVSGADGPRYIRGNRPLETGKWHHLTATYKGDEGAKLYLDGEEIANGPALGDLAWGGGNSLRIGGFTGGAKAWLKGWVDEVQIFAKNLSVEEIAAIMTPPKDIPQIILYKYPASPGPKKKAGAKKASGEESNEEIFLNLVRVDTESVEGVIQLNLCETQNGELQCLDRPVAELMADEGVYYLEARIGEITWRRLLTKEVAEKNKKILVGPVEDAATRALMERAKKALEIKGDSAQAKDLLKEPKHFEKAVAGYKENLKTVYDALPEKTWDAAKAKAAHSLSAETLFRETMTGREIVIENQQVLERLREFKE